MEFDGLQHGCPINITIPGPSLRYISRNVTQPGAYILQGHRDFSLIPRVLRKHPLLFGQDPGRSFPH
jgi:hypothetical protein